MYQAMERLIEELGGIENYVFASVSFAVLHLHPVSD